MSHQIAPLQPVKLPTLPASITPEQKFWRSFKSNLLINEYSSPTNINFSPIAPHDFAITSSTRVQIFSSKTRSVTKTISRFKDVAYSGNIRQDGKLLVAGDATGLIQIFDLNTRAILRTWKKHDRPVQVTKFSPTNLTRVLSASDDTSIRLWDLPTGETTSTFLGHTDYVRTASFLPSSSSEIILSGSYDNTVRLWDPRTHTSTSTSVLRFSHPEPIESVLGLPGGTTILVASGPRIYIWDLIAARLLTTLHNHQKTVTSLTLSSLTTDALTARRVLAGGLDGHVKIFDTTEWTVVHGIKYPSPILSLGVSPEEKHLVVGMSGGLLSIRTRVAGKDKVTAKKQTSLFNLIDQNLPDAPVRKHSQGITAKLRGLKYKGEEEDIIIYDDAQAAMKKARKAKEWERLLRQSRFSDALDSLLLGGAGKDGKKGETAAATGNVNPVEVVTLLTALRHRSALRQALSNRDEEGLLPVVGWVTKYVSNPRFVELLVEVALLILGKFPFLFFSFRFSFGTYLLTD